MIVEMVCANVVVSDQLLREGNGGFYALDYEFVQSASHPHKAFFAIVRMYD